MQFYVDKTLAIVDLVCGVLLWMKKHIVFYEVMVHFKMDP